MFRIPYSPKLKNQEVRKKPVAFIMHGLLSSSDSWVLNGPNDSIAFLMADAGYDTWIGNSRGNTYGREHATLSPLFPSFWDYTWDEIGTIDVPAMIDYTLYHTGEEKVHYVGHSQGTTSFLVLLSTIPSYNSKIKTSHLLAPVGFMENMQSPLAKVAAPFLGHPSLLAELFGNTEFLPSNKLFHLLAPEICQENSLFLPMCSNILFLIGGWDSQHFNYVRFFFFHVLIVIFCNKFSSPQTLMDAVMETHPAGSSTGQLIHYLQEKESGHFRKYDYGKLKNKRVYGTKVPPDYRIENIHPETPIHFYYSDNDYFAAVSDVHRMADHLADNVELHRVIYTDYNHLDYLWAENIKEVIYSCIVDLANQYENLPHNGESCNNFF